MVHLTYSCAYLIIQLKFACLTEHVNNRLRYRSRFWWLSRLQPVVCWGCGFESRQGHGCLSPVDAVCCQVAVSSTSRSLVQKWSTEPVCDLKTSTIRRPRSEMGCCITKKRTEKQWSGHIHILVTSDQYVFPRMYMAHNRSIKALLLKIQMHYGKVNLSCFVEFEVHSRVNRYRHWSLSSLNSSYLRSFILYSSLIYWRSPPFKVTHHRMSGRPVNNGRVLGKAVVV